MRMISRDVHILVFDTMADSEPSFATAGIENLSPASVPSSPVAASSVPPGLRLVKVAATREPITTMEGVRIHPDRTLEELSPSESRLLILPGGERWEPVRTRAAIAKAKQFIAACVPVAAIGAATLALARAGLLDNRYHTSTGRDYLAGSGYRGGRLYRDLPAVADQGVITASAAAPVEFARQIFEALHPQRSSTLEAWYESFQYRHSLTHRAVARCAGQ
jgi:putative intracellular protease/amidase